jgi:hypothetical protein
MTVEKTAFVFKGDSKDAGLNVCSTIRHEGKLWLVPEWFHNSATGKSKPARIICLDSLGYQNSNSPHYQYFLNTILPKSVFDGVVPLQKSERFLIVEHPDIEVDTQEISGQQN